MVYTKTGPLHSGRRGSYHGHNWYDDIVVLPDDERVMPFTVPNTEVREHPFGCDCEACAVYIARDAKALGRMKLRWRAQMRRASSATTVST